MLSAITTACQRGAIPTGAEGSDPGPAPAHLPRAPRHSTRLCQPLLGSPNSESRRLLPVPGPQLSFRAAGTRHLQGAPFAKRCHKLQRGQSSYLGLAMFGKTYIGDALDNFKTGHVLIPLRSKAPNKRLHQVPHALRCPVHNAFSSVPAAQ